jgi:Fe-S-cluster containining protein
MDDNKPCLSCGACCAHYRVSFYWAEADDATLGGVPAELTEKFIGVRRVMKGTNRSHPRCSALAGEIGHQVDCTIYSKRPQVCRDLQASWSAGRADEKCDKARAALGLVPLEEGPHHPAPMPLT